MTKKPLIWRHPDEYGSTPTARLERLWTYHGLLVGPKVKPTPRVRAHLERVASEIAFLESLEGSIQ